MRYLIATILLNTILSVIFKVLPRYKVDVLQAIVVNYWVCVVTGSLTIGYMPLNASGVRQPWFPWALVTGACFIMLFNLIAYRTRVDGITTTTIANKLSLVIPVLLAIILYKEHDGVWSIAGIVLAFPAVYLTSRTKEGNKDKPVALGWLALLFIGSGLLDALVNFVQHSYLPATADQSLFTIYTFAAAGSIGTVLLVVLMVLKRIQLSWRSVLAGICIGVPNYFSIYYFIRLLHSGFLQSSAAIPVNNIGILVVSTLTALLLFKERVTWLRFIGLVLAITAIIFIAFGDRYGGI
jgi:drug/metabolite transporter (DMT)-like permease